ncbi:MAG: aminotransferase class V-fold PLP-dependent enzyme [Chloroflexota bacterium]|nr:aminotransferase class V-fold PLP-dependent enzyme [Chloroflexota bacterium]
MSVQAVYMDHAATTGVHPEVLQAMLPYLGPEYGNPSSSHRLGQVARQAVQEARERVAGVLNCQPSEVVFTSCGTESINLAIKGIVKAAGGRGHIITTAIEHHAVLHTVEQLEREGYESTVLPVSSEGLLDPQDVRRAIRPDTRLISVMYANNEIGTVQPVAEVARIGQEAGIPVHSDCVQAAGSLALDVDALGVTSLALSGHKFYAPKGVGVLYLKAGTPVQVQQQGGGQEGGLRSGTENVPYIVGLSVALERAHARREEYNEHCSRLRDKIFERLVTQLPDVRINGHLTQRLANNAHVSFRGVEAQAILMGLDMKNIYASSGSACVSASLEPSHVLKAIGVPQEYIYGSLRLTVGEATTEKQVEYALEHLPPIVRRLQALSPLATT